MYFLICRKHHRLREATVTRKECKSLREEFEVGGFTAQKVLWNIAKKRLLEDRGALLEEVGDLVRENRAMYEKHSLSSLLRDSTEDKNVRNRDS